MKVQKKILGMEWSKGCADCKCSYVNVWLVEN